MAANLLPCMACAAATLLLAACGNSNSSGPDTAGATPGVLLGKMACAFNLDGIAVPIAACYQITYATTDTRGLPSQTLATIFVPTNAPPAGQRVLVSYQPAEDGLTTKCAPSNTLKNGTELAMGDIGNALSKGWVVVVPDFEGPDSEFEARATAAHAVLDGIRATESLAESGLQGRATPVALWGYSGGGYGTLAPAEAQSEYAPELNVAGIAEGGSAFDIRSTFAYLDGGPFAGVVFAGLAGVVRAYAYELNIDDYFNDAGKFLLADLAGMCVAHEASGVPDPAYGYPFQKLDMYTKVPDTLDLPGPAKVVADDSLGKGKPNAPIFLYHGSADELISYTGQAVLQFNTYCGMGVPVDFFTLPLGEHVETSLAGAPLALQFLSDRFAGKPLAPLPGDQSCNIP
ncbi:MAG: lipase family protein [Stenotrophobium sp.]